MQILATPLLFFCMSQHIQAYTLPYSRQLLIEKVEGLSPAKSKESLGEKDIKGTAIKVGQRYSLTLNLLFMESSQNVFFSFSTYYHDSCEFNVDNIYKPYYQKGEHERVNCQFTPRKQGKDVLNFYPLEKIADGRTKGLNEWAAFPITIRPAMDLRCMTSLEGVSMAAREGWLTLAVGALAFVGLAWRRAPLRKWKGWAWLAGWTGATFLGQLGVWFLMDKLFLSYPERVFTPFDHFNLPAILSAVITLTAGWFALRRQGGGKADPV